MQQVVGVLRDTRALVDNIGTQVFVSGLVDRRVYINKPPVQKTTGIVVADPDAPPDCYSVHDFALVSSSLSDVASVGGGGAGNATSVAAATNAAAMSLLTTPAARSLPPPAPTTGTLSGPTFAQNEMHRLGWSPWVYHQQQYLYRNGLTSSSSSSDGRHPRLSYAVKLASPSGEEGAASGGGSALIGGGGVSSATTLLEGSDCAVATSATATPIAILAFQQQLYDFHHRRMIPLIDDDAWLVSDPGNITHVQWLLPHMPHVMAAPSFFAAGTVPDGSADLKPSGANSPSAPNPSANKKTTASPSSPPPPTAEQEALEAQKYAQRVKAVRDAIAADASLAWCLIVFFERSVALVQLETEHSCGFDDKEEPTDPSDPPSASYNRHPYSDVADNKGGFTSGRVVWNVSGRYNTAEVCPIDWHLALGYCCSDADVGKAATAATGTDDDDDEEDENEARRTAGGQLDTQSVLVFMNGASEKKITAASTSPVAVGGCGPSTTSLVQTSPTFLSSSIDTSLFRLSTTAVCIRYPRGRWVRSFDWRRARTSAVLAVSVWCPASLPAQLRGMGNANGGSSGDAKTLPSSPLLKAGTSVFPAITSAAAAATRESGAAGEEEEEDDDGGERCFYDTQVDVYRVSVTSPASVALNRVLHAAPATHDPHFSSAFHPHHPHDHSNNNATPAKGASSSSASNTSGFEQRFMFPLPMSGAAATAGGGKSSSSSPSPPRLLNEAANALLLDSMTQSEGYLWELQKVSMVALWEDRAKGEAVFRRTRGAKEENTQNMEISSWQSSSSSASSSSAPFIVAVVPHNSTTHDTSGDKLRIVEVNKLTGALYYHAYAVSDSTITGGSALSSLSPSSSARGGGVYNPIALKDFVETFGEIAQIHVLPQSGDERAVCDVFGGSVAKQVVRQQLLSNNNSLSSPAPNHTSGGGSQQSRKPPPSLLAGGSSSKLVGATGLVKSPRTAADIDDFASDFEDISNSFCCVFGKAAGKEGGAGEAAAASLANQTVAEAVSSVISPMASLNHVVLERHGKASRHQLKLVVVGRFGATALVSVNVSGEVRTASVEHLFHFGIPLTNRVASLPSAAGAAIEPSSLPSSSPPLQLTDKSSSSSSFASLSASPRVIDICKGVELRDLGSQPAAPTRSSSSSTTSGHAKKASSAASSSSSSTTPPYPFVCSSSKVLGNVPLVAVMYGDDAEDGCATTSASSSSSDPSVLIHLYHMSSTGDQCVPLAAHRVKRRRDVDTVRAPCVPPPAAAAVGESTASKPSTAANATSASSASTAKPVAAAAPAAAPAVINKDVVIAFMNVHSPAMVSRVDMLLTAMKGDAEKLLKNLRTKHNVADDDDSWMPAEMKAAFAAPPPPPPSQSVAAPAQTAESTPSGEDKKVVKKAVALGTKEIPIGIPMFVSLVLATVPTLDNDPRLVSPNNTNSAATAGGSTSPRFTATNTRTNAVSGAGGGTGGADVSSVFVMHPKVLLVLVFDECRQLWGAAEVVCDLNPITNSFTNDLLGLAPITPQTLSSTALAPIIPASSSPLTQAATAVSSGLSNASIASLVAGAISHGHHPHRPTSPLPQTSRQPPATTHTSVSAMTAATTFAKPFAKWGRALAAFPAIPSLYRVKDLLAAKSIDDVNSLSVTIDAERLLRSVSQSGLDSVCNPSAMWQYDSALVLQRHSAANVPTVIRWMKEAGAGGEEGSSSSSSSSSGAGRGGAPYTLAARYHAHTNVASLFVRRAPHNEERSQTMSSLEVPSAVWELLVRLQTGGSNTDMTFMCPRVVLDDLDATAHVNDGESSSSAPFRLPRSDILIYKGPTVVSVVVLFGSLMMVFQLDPGRALSTPLVITTAAEEEEDASASEKKTSSSVAAGSSATFELVFAQFGVLHMFALPAAAKGSIARGKPIGGSNLAKPSLLTVTALPASLLFPSSSAVSPTSGQLLRRRTAAAAGLSPLPADPLAAPISFAIDLAAPLAVSAGLHHHSTGSSEGTVGSASSLLGGGAQRRKVGSFVAGSPLAAELLLRCFGFVYGEEEENCTMPPSAPSLGSPIVVVRALPFAESPTHVVDLSGAPLQQPPAQQPSGGSSFTASSVRQFSPGPSGYFSPSSTVNGGGTLRSLSGYAVGSAGGAFPPFMSSIARTSDLLEMPVYRIEIITNPHRVNKWQLGLKTAAAAGESSRSLSNTNTAAQRGLLGRVSEFLVSAICILRPPPKVKSRFANSTLRSMVLVGGANVSSAMTTTSGSYASSAPLLLQPSPLFTTPLELLLTSPFTAASSDRGVTSAVNTARTAETSSTSVAAALSGPYPEAVELLRDAMAMFTEGRWPSLVRALAHLIQMSRKHTNRVVASAIAAAAASAANGGRSRAATQMQPSQQQQQHHVTEDGVFGSGGGPEALDDPSVYLTELLAAPVSSNPRPSEEAIRSLVCQFLSLGAAPLSGGLGGGSSSIGNENDPQILDLRTRVPVVDPEVVATLHKATAKGNTSMTNRSLIHANLPPDAAVATSGPIDVFRELLDGLASVGASGLTEAAVQSIAEAIANGGGGGGNDDTNDENSNGLCTTELTGVSDEIIRFLSIHLGIRLYNGQGALKLLADSSVTEEASISLSVSSPSYVDPNADEENADGFLSKKKAVADKVVAVLQPSGSRLSGQASSFLEALCVAAVDTLTNCSIVGLTSSQQLEVYVSLETIRTMLGQSGRMDEASKRLLTLWRQREVNKKFAASSASFAPVTITPSSMCWAMLSDAQDQLVDTINPTTWADCVTSGIPLWTKSLLTLRRVAETVGKNLYGAARDIKECALMYVLAKKVSTLMSFAKNCNDMRLHDFFSRDFSQRINQKAAVANGFAAMSKGALTYGSAFFVLGGDAISAAMGIVQRTGDWMLGLMIVRLGYDDDAQRIEEYLQFLEQSPDVKLSMWERCALRWRQGQYVDALKELWVAQSGSAADAQPSSPAGSGGGASAGQSSNAKSANNNATNSNVNEATEVLQFLQYCCGGVTVLARTRKEDILPLEVRARLHLASARHNARRGLVASAAREYLLLWVALDRLGTSIDDGSLLAAYAKEADDAKAKAKAAEEAAKLPPPKIQADFNTGTIAMFGMDSDDDDDDQQHASPTTNAAASPPKPEPAPKLPKGSDSDDDSEADGDDDDNDEYEEDEEEEEESDDEGIAPPNVRPRPPTLYNVTFKAQWLANAKASIPMLLIEAKTYLSSYLAMVAPPAAASAAASILGGPNASHADAIPLTSTSSTLVNVTTTMVGSLNASPTMLAFGAGKRMHNGGNASQRSHGGGLTTNVHGPVEYDEYGAPIRTRRRVDTSAYVKELLGNLLTLGSNFESPPSGASKETLSAYTTDLLSAYDACSDRVAKGLIGPILLWVLSAFALANRSEALGAAICIVTLPLEPVARTSSSDDAAADRGEGGDTLFFSPNNNSSVIESYLKQLAMATTVLRNETFQHFVHLSDLLESGAINGSALRLAEARCAWGGRMRFFDDSMDVFRLMRVHTSQTIRSLIALRMIPTSNILVTRLLLQSTIEYMSLSHVLLSKRSYVCHKQLTPLSAMNAATSASVATVDAAEAYEASSAGAASSLAPSSLTAAGHWSLHSGLVPLMDEIPAFSALRWTLVAMLRLVMGAVDREVELQRQAHQALIVSSAAQEGGEGASAGQNPTAVALVMTAAAEANQKRLSSIDGSKTADALSCLGRAFCAFGLLGAVRQPATILWPLQAPLTAFSPSSLQGQLLQEVSSNRALVLALECIGNYRLPLTSQDKQLGMNGAITEHDGSLMEAMSAPVGGGESTNMSRQNTSNDALQSASPFSKGQGGGGGGAFGRPSNTKDNDVSPLSDVPHQTPLRQPFLGTNALEEVAWLWSLTRHTHASLREAAVLTAIRCSTDAPQAELLPLLSNDPRSVGLSARKEIATSLNPRETESKFNSGNYSANSSAYFASGSRLVGASPYSPVASGPVRQGSSSGASASFFSTANSSANAFSSGGGASSNSSNAAMSTAHTFRFRSSGLARDRTQLVSDSHGVTAICVDRSSYDSLAVSNATSLSCLHGMRDHFLFDADGELIRHEQPLRENATTQFASSFRPDREGYGGWSHMSGVVSKFGSTGHTARAVVGATQRNVSFGASFSPDANRGGDNGASTLAGTSCLESHPYLPVYIATSSAGRCSIFQFGNEDRIAHFNDNSCGQLNDVTFSPHGDNIVLTGSKGTISLWKFGALPSPFRLLPMHFTEANDAKFINNKNSVVAVVGHDAPVVVGGGSSTGPRFPFGNSSSSAGAARGKLSIIDFALPHHHGLAATVQLPFSNPAYVLHDPFNSPTIIGAMDNCGHIALFDIRMGRLLPQEVTPRIELGAGIGSFSSAAGGLQSSGGGGGGGGDGRGGISRPSILNSSRDKDAAATSTASAVALCSNAQLLAVGTQCGDLALFSTRGFWGANAWGQSTYASDFIANAAPFTAASSQQPAQVGHIPLQPIMATSTSVTGRRPPVGNLNALAVADIIFTPSALVYATGEGKVMGSPLISSVVRQLY